MSTQDRRSAADGVGLGVAFGATGIYFILAALGVLPAPGGEDAANAPAAIIVCAGLAFLLAGLVMAIRAAAGARGGESEQPADTPRWTHLAYRVLAIAAAGSLAAIGTWIAIGSGPRAFIAAGPFFEMRTTGDAIGRTVFGLGAVIVWITVIAFTVGTVRKLFSRRG
jgi:hypothetical protein